MNKKLLALYGLKWNPCSPELPTEALYITPRIEHFYWRIEQGLIQEGGFALITGDPGTGKSAVLRLLAERLELLPLGSRLRTRLAMEYADRNELMACLKHLLTSAGNANLMTPELMQTLCDHAVGNHRVLTSMAAELLASAAQQEITRLEEKLYLEVFGVPASKSRKSA